MNLLARLLLLPIRCIRAIIRICVQLTGADGASKPMDGAGYEQFVAQYLRERGFRQVQHTGSTGDFGVDIVARKHGVRYAVQCKYYTGSVSGAAVQEAVAGMAYYGCDRAVVVTNSQLTRGAWALAEANHVLVVERLQPSKHSVAGVATPGRLISLMACLILSMLLLPRLRTGNATRIDVYVLAVLGFYLLPRIVLEVLGWVWRRLTRRNNP